MAGLKLDGLPIRLDRRAQGLPQAISACFKLSRA